MRGWSVRQHAGDLLESLRLAKRTPAETAHYWRALALHREGRSPQAVMVCRLAFRAMLLRTAKRTWTPLLPA